MDQGPRKVNQPMAAIQSSSVLSAFVWAAEESIQEFPSLNQPSNRGLARFMFYEIVHKIASRSHTVQFSHSVMSDSLRSYGLQHARLPGPSPTPGAYSNSYPFGRWCQPTISSSVIRFFSCLQSFPASGSFLMSWFFTSGGWSTGVWVSAAVLPMNIQDWFSLGLTGLISLQSKGLSRVFSNTTLQKHQFFSTQPSLWSNSHIHTWLLEKP